MFAKNLWSKKKVREVLPLSLLTTHPTSFQLNIWCFIERIFAIQWGAIASLFFFLFRTTIVYKTTWKGQLWNQILDRPCFKYKVTLALIPAEGQVADGSSRTQVPADWCQSSTLLLLLLVQQKAVFFSRLEKDTRKKDSKALSGLIFSQVFSYVHCNIKRYSIDRVFSKKNPKNQKRIRLWHFTHPVISNV